MNKEQVESQQMADSEREARGSRDSLQDSESEAIGNLAFTQNEGQAVQKATEED